MIGKVHVSCIYLKTFGVEKCVDYVTLSSLTKGDFIEPLAYSINCIVLNILNLLYPMVRSAFDTTIIDGSQLLQWK